MQIKSRHRTGFQRATRFAGVSVGWIAYLPLPGLAVIPVLLDGQSAQVRFHAWQGGVLVGLVWLALIMIGLLGEASDSAGFQTFIGILALPVIIGYIVGAAVGMVSSIRATFARVRPVYDLLAMFGR